MNDEKLLSKEDIKELKEARIIMKTIIEKVKEAKKKWLGNAIARKNVYILIRRNVFYHKIKEAEKKNGKAWCFCLFYYFGVNYFRSFIDGLGVSWI